MPRDLSLTNSLEIYRSGRGVFAILSLTFSTKNCREGDLDEGDVAIIKLSTTTPVGGGGGVGAD